MTPLDRTIRNKSVTEFIDREIVYVISRQPPADKHRNAIIIPGAKFSEILIVMRMISIPHKFTRYAIS